MSTFSERLLELRKNKGINGTELAKIVGVDKSTISKYESGSLSAPTLPVLQRLSDYFDVSLDYISGNSNIKERGITASALKDIFDLLNDDNKIKLVSYAKFLKSEQGNDTNE